MQTSFYAVDSGPIKVEDLDGTSVLSGTLKVPREAYVIVTQAVACPT
jgi:hypothetical protein